MRRAGLGALAIVAAAVGLLHAQLDPLALQRMVATERAFAAATADLGVRDGFLTFFAEDAIQIDHAPSGVTSISRAKDALIRQPLAKLPLSGTLLWEPFTGQVSDDGTMGWLTGAYAGLDQTGKTITAHGAYFSVWKRQPDGTWRVWLDEGVALPDVWRDAAPFRVMPDPDVGEAGTPGETLEAAEQAVAHGGSAWIDRLSRDVRVHVQGLMPLVGREAAIDWDRASRRAVTFDPLKLETPASDDLGIALGGDRASTPGGTTNGTWVRVWKRDLTGRWRIVFETRTG